MNIDGKLKLAKNFVTSKAGRQLLKTQKHSPVILFSAGVIGVVATTVLASKATLKLDAVISEHEKKISEAEELLASHHDNYSATDFTKDSAVLKVRFVKDVVKLYAPAIGLGMLSIGCLTGSHVVLTRRNASLVAAYAALDKGFNEYRQRVTELVGEDKEKELRYGSESREVAVDTDKGVKIENMTTVGPNGASIYARFFDQLCPNWSPQPEYNLVFLRAQQQYANDMLHARGHIFLNEIYDMLGIERTKAGAVVGWVKGNADNYVDFGIFDGDNPRARDFVNGREGAILLDFNVDGVVYDLI